MEGKFDVFCSSKFSLAEPRFLRVCSVDPVMRLIGNKHTVGDDGYLGVRLTQLESLWLAKVLRRMGIDTYPVSERYKSPSISNMVARQVAQNFILERRLKQPEYEFTDVEEVALPWWLSQIAFGYISKSEKMKLDGISPAGITVCVDRVDGFILQEMQLLNAELAIMLIE